LLAEGFEEVEAITPIDYVRRAGAEVTTLGVTGEWVSGSHGIRVQADRILDVHTSDTADTTFDMVVVPGGGRGSAAIAASQAARQLIQRHDAAGTLIAAICAAPAVVLHGSCNLLAGKRFTGYPGTEKSVTGAIFVAERVVIDGRFITARAAGCAGEFSIALVEALFGASKARSIAAGVLLD
jgi:4-methyl-5(b-hydroxyethyl)-thiazole monophosphate biosynthesis